MIVGDIYRSRTSNDLLTIFRVGLNDVSASGSNPFCSIREDCSRALFDRLYAFTGVNNITGAPLNITKNMMIGERT